MKKVSPNVVFMKKCIPFSIALLILTACSVPINISPKPLTPLLDPLPMVIETDYEEKFSKHKVKQRNAANTRTRRTFNLGKAQKTLFDSVFTHLAQQLVDTSQIAKNNKQTIGGSSSENGRLPRLKVRPILRSLKVSDPADNAQDIYEVTINYQLLMIDMQTGQQATWPLEGYGRASNAFFKFQTSAFNQAAQNAFRQIGAKIATEFSKQPLVQKMLVQPNQIALPNQPDD